MGESGTPHVKSNSWTSKMKTFHGLRKRNKPLVEKKRRARINESLAQLKALVLESMQTETVQYSKLEKADILEMTVQHLVKLRQYTNNRDLVSKYRVGYNECANEVVRYLGQTNDVDTSMRTRLLNHLSGCIETGNVVRSQSRSENCTASAHEVAMRLGNAGTDIRFNSLNLVDDKNKNSVHNTENIRRGLQERVADGEFNNHEIYSATNNNALYFSSQTNTSCGRDGRQEFLLENGQITSSNIFAYYAPTKTITQDENYCMRVESRPLDRDEVTCALENQSSRYGHLQSIRLNGNFNRMNPRVTWCSSSNEISNNNKRQLSSHPNCDGQIISSGDNNAVSPSPSSLVAPSVWRPW